MPGPACSIESPAEPAPGLMTGSDEAQWIAWYKSLEKPLYNLAFRWLWDPAESQDVVQEAFLNCWKIRARIVPEGFKALIFRTTMRLASNRVRRRRTWRMATLNEQDHPGADRGSSDMLADRELQAALAAMPEPLKRVLLLSELGGLSYKEIADVMRTREGTVGSRRSRAIADLRERLAARGVEWHED